MLASSLRVSDELASRMTWLTHQSKCLNQEQLITDNHKLVLLAALSDSLDYLSESAQQWVFYPSLR